MADNPNFDGVLDPEAGWPDVPQWSSEANVLGGAGGPMVAPLDAIVARTKYAKGKLDALSSASGASGVGFQLPSSAGQTRDIGAVIAETPRLTDFWLPEDAVNYAPAFNRAADYSRGNQVEILVNTSCSVYQTVDISGAKFRCAHGVVIRATGLNGTILFKAAGTAGDEIDIAANLTTGNTTVTTTTAHGLVPGDWVLLQSQRVCAMSDAGEKWQLGTVTDISSDFPYFAEPLQVAAVLDDTSFTTSAIIFPSYRTDATQETYPGVRTKSTIKKIGFVTGTQFIGGTIMAPTKAAHMFDFLWAFQPVLDCEFQLANAPGQAIYSKYTYGANCKAVVSRPFDWTIVASHAQYNSIRDVSSWYGDYDLVEYFGSQGFDQTYADICSIHPRVKVKAYRPLESGCTTHGNTYGITIDALVIGHKRQAVSNRARFADIKLTSIGEFGTLVCDAISVSEWGQQNLKLVLDARNVRYGIEFSTSQASIDDSPEVIIGDVTGTVTNATAFMHLGTRVTNGAKPNSYFIHNIRANNCRYVVLGGAYWHGFRFDGVAINGDPIAGSPGPMFSFENNSAFHTMKNVTATAITAPYLVRTLGLDDTVVSAAAFGLAVDVEWSTVTLTNSATTKTVTGTKTSMVATRVPDIITRGAFNRLIVLDLVNTSLARTLALSTDLVFPVGAYLDLFNRGAQSILITVGDGITLLGTPGPFATNSRTRITRIDETKYWVSAA